MAKITGGFAANRRETVFCDRLDAELSTAFASVSPSDDATIRRSNVIAYRNAPLEIFGQPMSQTSQY